MNLKLLWYCTKAKGKNYYLRKLPNGRYCLSRDKGESLNGKIVVESDYEVEEITNCGTSFMIMKYDDLYESYIYTSKVAKGSCLNFDDLKRYLGTKNGYAIHVENLNIFDKARELSECDQINNCCFEKEADKLDLEGLPIFFCAFTNACKYQSDGHTCDKSFFPFKHIHNMSKVYDKQDYKYKYIISVTPQEACNILNHKQDILIRKNVLKEMKECLNRE